MAGLERVYVAGHVETYHVTTDCELLVAALRRTSSAVLWCWAAAAHRSRLVPCPSCAGPLTAALRAELGSVPSGARRGMGLPALESLASAVRGRATPALRPAGRTPLEAVRPVDDVTDAPGGQRTDPRARAAEIEDLLTRALAAAHSDLEPAVAGWADPAAS